MKSLILSVKPKYVADILNGLKTIEIRKRFPKDYRGWVYIYCTKDKLKDYYYDKDILGCYFRVNLDDNLGYEYYKNLKPLNGKVVARFYCDNVDVHHILPTEKILPFNKNVEEKLVQLCLTKEDVMNYGNGEDYYAKLINISKLEIFDTPKELSEFKSYKKNIVNAKINGMVFETELDNSLTKAPQNYMYIEV